MRTIGMIIKALPPSGTAIIEMPVGDLQSLIKLKKHYPDIESMIESGVFDFKNGQALIHRDNDGNLRKIEINVIKFRN